MNDKIIVTITGRKPEGVISTTFFLPPNTNIEEWLKKQNGPYYNCPHISCLYVPPPQLQK